jgi:hypothetical protein
MVRLTLALLIAGCATGRGAQGPRGVGEEVDTTIEVRLPADAYTPLAQVLPTLHEIAWRMCGLRYRIVDRRMDFGIDAVPAYNPTSRIIRPQYRHSYSIVALIQCLRPRRTLLPPESRER